MTRVAHKISSAVAWFYDHAPNGTEIQIQRRGTRTRIHVIGERVSASRTLEDHELAALNLTDVVADLVASLRDLDRAPKAG
jgi:hypothetical protein